LSEKGVIVHPTISDQLAREVQRDRLTRAAQARLVREARVQEPEGDRSTAFRARLRRLFAAVV
jgi:hypothetical protein